MIGGTIEHIAADVTIAGAGVAGLWAGKEFVDMGLSVAVVEAGPEMAMGATTRNEGWLHDGTYHSVAIDNPVDAMAVTERTRYGHRAITNFAPESIDHERSYGFAHDPQLADIARERWEMAGVPYQELRPNTLQLLGDTTGMDISRVAAAFRVTDKSVNSRVLCAKLAQHILNGGGRIIRNAQLYPESPTTATIQAPDRRLRIESQRFLLTVGAGVQAMYRRVTGEDLAVRFFKAHLGVYPRLTFDNLFYLDAGEAGVMGHGTSSIVGINRDGVELAHPDYEVVPDKARLVHEAVVRLLPRAAQYPLGGQDVEVVACVKPDLYANPADVQSLNVRLLEPVSGYVFAFPGKMTEAPYMGRAVADHFQQTGVRPEVPRIYRARHRDSVAPLVHARPADDLMRRRAAHWKLGA